jgi:hypothetical protein
MPVANDYNNNDVINITTSKSILLTALVAWTMVTFMAGVAIGGISLIVVANIMDPVNKETRAFTIIKHDLHHRVSL